MKPFYDHGGIQIFNADCRDILPQLPDKSVDLVLTDPPYGHNNNNGDLIHNWEKALGRGEPGQSRPIAQDGPEEATELARLLFSESNRLLRPGGCCCCCCCGGGPDPQFARWSLWMDELLGFKHAVVWDKMGLGMGWHYRRTYEMILVGQKPGGPCKWYGDNNESNILHIPKIIPSAKQHPTLKPAKLMQVFIRLHSTQGDIVLDPFMGSGTTLRACKDMGRSAIGIEISQEYCQMAVDRLAQEVLFPM